MSSSKMATAYHEASHYVMCEILGVDGLTASIESAGDDWKGICWHNSTTTIREILISLAGLEGELFFDAETLGLRGFQDFIKASRLLYDSDDFSGQMESYRRVTRKLLLENWPRVQEVAEELYNRLEISDVVAV